MSDVFTSVDQALDELREGRMLIVVDDEARENEGDFIMAAARVTPQAINFMATFGRGLICQAVTAPRAEALQLSPMVEENSSLHSTALTVSVDAKDGTTTGISAFDRAATVKVIVDPESKPQDLLRPGHIFPLIAKNGGVLERDGHTETAVDMARLAGLYPSGVLCEILDDDGTMAKLPRLMELAVRFDLKILKVADVIAYREAREKQIVQRQTEAKLPTELGEFRLILYKNLLEPELSPFALVKGHPEQQETPLVRIHSECLTGEALLSRRCDCGGQLHQAMERVQAEGGVIVYLRQEGRGIGFANKIRAYHLQEQGLDTVEANLRLGFRADERDYFIGAKILEDLGIRRLRLMTNNPHKLAALEEAGLAVVQRVSIETLAHQENRSYLLTKKQRCGHLLQTN